MEMTEKNKIEVNVFGQNYTLRGEAPPEYLNRISLYADEKMREVSKEYSIVSSTKVAVLASIHLADEIFQLREEVFHLRDEVFQLRDELNKISNDLEKRSKNLIEIIDRGLEIEG